MKKIEAVFRPERLDHVARSLDEAGFQGFTITDARGHGRSPDKVGEWRGVAYEMLVTHKLSITVIVEDTEVEDAVRAIVRGAATGSTGDGLITVSDLAAVYRITPPAPPSAPAPEATSSTSNPS